MEQTRRNLLKSITAFAGGAMMPFGGNSQPGMDTLNMQNGDPTDLSEIINLFDFEKMAEGKMTKMAYEYVASGAADEFTVRWNRQALDTIKLNPTVLADVLKAIALGANAVLVGKPKCFGLACGRADGVTKVLDIFRTEFELAMALTGRATIADIEASVIWK